MFIPVTDPNKIIEFHNRVNKSLKDIGAEKIQVNIGHQGNDYKSDDVVYYSEKLNIWWVSW